MFLHDVLVAVPVVVAKAPCCLSCDVVFDDCVVDHKVPILISQRTWLKCNSVLIPFSFCLPQLFSRVKLFCELDNQIQVYAAFQTHNHIILPFQSEHSTREQRTHPYQHLSHQIVATQEFFSSDLTSWET